MTDKQQLEVRRSSSEGTFRRLTFSIVALFLTVIFFWKFFDSSLESDGGSEDNNATDKKETRIEKKVASEQHFTHTTLPNGKPKVQNNHQQQQQLADDLGDLSSILLDESYLRKSSEMCEDSLDTITEDDDEDAAVISEQMEQDDLLLEEAETDDVFDETSTFNSRFATPGGGQNLTFLSDGSTSLQAEISDTDNNGTSSSTDLQCSPLPEDGQNNISPQEKDSDDVKLDTTTQAAASRDLTLPLVSVLDRDMNNLAFNNDVATQLADKQQQRRLTFVAKAQAKAVLSEDQSPTFQTDTNPNAGHLNLQIDEIVEEAVTEGENPYVTVARAMAKAASAAAQAAMRSLAASVTTGDIIPDASSRPVQLVLTASCTLCAESSRFLRYAAQTPASNGVAMNLYSPFAPQSRLAN